MLIATSQATLLFSAELYLAPTKIVDFVRRWSEKTEISGGRFTLEDARRLIQGYVKHYNNVRRNSAVGYTTQKDMLAGRQQEIQAERNRTFEDGRREAGNRRHFRNKLASSVDLRRCRST
jgi:hypothetical protein